MKLLFDHNLSPALVTRLSSEFPDSAHVRDLGLSRATDTVIWSYAAANGFVIVSKDVDFQRRALLRGAPPKVVWIRLGNCLTDRVVSLVQSHQVTLIAFVADPSASFIALG